MLVLLLASTHTKFADNVAVLAFTPEHVLVDDKALESDGAPCMYAPGADAHLRTKAVPEPICEPGAGVDKRPCRVDATTEDGSRILVLGDDAVRVVRRVSVDVRNCGRERRHGENGERQREVLRPVVGRLRRADVRRQF